MKGIYDKTNSCNYCGEASNKIIKIDDTINGHISACSTKCSTCGFEDYWDTGHYMSSQDGFNSSAKY